VNNLSKPKKRANKKTSPKVATNASKILRDKRFSKKARSVAASALSQA